LKASIVVARILVHFAMRGSVWLVVALAATLGAATAESPTLSAGVAHTCAIDASDAVHCWGDDSLGQSSPPRDVRGWRVVAASKGGCHTCGVDLDGALRCWGCNDSGEVGPLPEVAGGWIDVSAGKRFTCGVASADRAVRCWGRFLPQMRGAWFGPWAAVTAGEDWVCALRRDDRTAHCRGWSPTGQTDVPDTLRTVAFDALSAGFQHTCGVVASDKSLACWGADFFGEASAFPAPGVPGPGVSELTLPVEDPTDPRAGRWGAVAAGTRRTCGVRGAARTLECWGERRDYPPEATAAFGEYGLVPDAGTLVRAGACSWDVVAVGKDHACGILAVPASGRGVDENVTNTATDADLDVVDAAAAVAAAVAFSPGDILCWGDGSSGQTRAPDESDGVVLPWRAWPAVPDEWRAGSTFGDLRESATATCDATSDAAGTIGGVGTTGAIVRVAIVMLVALVAE
jgi:hypothetical protein